MSFDAAAEALAGAAAQDVSAHTPVEQAVAPSVSPPVDAGTNQSSESFTQFDINSLPEDLRDQANALYRQLQGDYTRKTQEVAPFRNILRETGLSVEQAQQALQFTMGLNDPSVRQSLYTQLQQEFAAQEGYYQQDAEEVDPRDRQLQELNQRLSQWETRQAQQTAQMHLERDEQAIKAQHPDWTDDPNDPHSDMNKVRRLAFSFNGDLHAAADEFNAWRNAVLGGYVASKGTVNTAAVPPGATSHAATPPQAFPNLQDKGLHKAAMAHLLTQMADS